MTRLSLLACLLVPCAVAFKPSLLPTTPRAWNKIHLTSTAAATTTTTAASSRLFVQPTNHNQQEIDKRSSDKLPLFSLMLSTIRHRLDTCKSAGITNARTAGVWGKIKKIHDPITYIILAAAAGFRWEWCFRNPYYWFAVGFCIKWYRARYVFKIPVWDRQPNWNNIITSKEQEKDLKAFTCKQCGSTLFIAKTREFFFEGSTGIGGLGCFSCGAKGKDNFVMDRDRIVEDVADMDDYFEYERPLDFVSRAERRKLLKEAAGDEEKANQLLLERQTGEQAEGDDQGATATVDAETVVDAETQEQTDTEEATSSDDESAPKLEAEETTATSTDDESAAETASPAAEASAESPSSSEALNGTPPAADEEESSPAPEPPKAEKKKKKKDKPKPPPAPVSDEDMFDALDMDAL